MDEKQPSSKSPVWINAFNIPLGMIPETQKEIVLYLEQKNLLRNSNTNDS